MLRAFFEWLAGNVGSKPTASHRPTHHEERLAARDLLRRQIDILASPARSGDRTLQTPILIDDLTAAPEEIDRELSAYGPEDG